jgi:hypothetical protein
MNSYINTGSKPRKLNLIKRKFPEGYDKNEKSDRPSGVVSDKDGGYTNISTVGYVSTKKGANTYLPKHQQRK